LVADAEGAAVADAIGACADEEADAVGLGGFDGVIEGVVAATASAELDPEDSWAIVAEGLGAGLPIRLTAMPTKISRPTARHPSPTTIAMRSCCCFLVAVEPASFGTTI
jgi:hypothetical protein